MQSECRHNSYVYVSRITEKSGTQKLFPANIWQVDEEERAHLVLPPLLLEHTHKRVPVCANLESWHSLTLANIQKPAVVKI